MASGGNFGCTGGVGCEPIATTGWCLADGSPIIIVTERDCESGVITHAGWVNVQTGAFTAGAIPPGVVACGEGQSIQVSGVFCDVNAAGDVVGLVLVEYHYAADGSIESVRLVNATTGATYVPAPGGQITVCPAGSNLDVDVEYQVLCDTAADGTVTRFLRRYLYDPVAATVSHVDTLLDGATVYNPGPTVGECPSAGPVDVVPQVFQHQEILCDQLPDTAPGTSPATVTVTATDPAASGVPLNYGAPVSAPLPAATAFFAGNLGAVPASPAVNTHAYMVGVVAVDPACGDLDPAGTSQLTITARVRNTNPPGGNCGCGLWGRFTAWDTAGPTNLAAALPAPDQGGNLGVLNDAATFSICGGQVWDETRITRTVTVPNAALLAGRVRVELNVQTGQDTTSDGTGCPSNGAGGVPYAVDHFTATVTPVPVTGCPATPGAVVPFIRKYIEDAAGVVVDTVDLTLAGAPYLVSAGGTVARCPQEVTGPDGGPVVVTGPDGAPIEVTGPDGGPVTVDGTVEVTGPAGGPVQVQVTDSACRHCQTERLCDQSGAGVPATIIGAGVSAGLLANGVGWTARGPAAPTNSRLSNVDGAWWNQVMTFPNVPVGPQTWQFDKLVNVDFSVYIQYAAPPQTDPDQNKVQLPAGVEPVTLLPGFTYDPATRILTVGPTAGQTCTNLTAPTEATANRFRTTVPLTSLTLEFLGARIASCGQFGNWAFGAFDVTPAGGQFLRTICRDCDGTVVSVTNTLLDGVTVYNPQGDVGPCPVETCGNCETQQLCDVVSAGPTGHVAGAADPDPGSAYDWLGHGVAENGIGWAAEGDASVEQRPILTNAEGSWWGVSNYPNGSFGPVTWTLDKPAVAEFSVGLAYVAGIPTQNDVQITLPAGVSVEVVDLPLGYTYNPATRVVSKTSTVPTDCTVFTNPTAAKTARFRTSIPVTSFTLDPLGQAVPVCAQPANFIVGGIVLNPPAVAFLRTLCRDCDTTTVTDTRLDGKTAYIPVGTVTSCELAAGHDCCQPVQVCVQLVGTAEFISNEPHKTDGTVDDVWEWTPDTNGLPLNDPAFGPSPTATWYDMYRPTAAPLGRWVITDTDTDRPAFWITPHPSSSSNVVPPALPGEGPNVAANTDWIARASFDLDPDADPATIRVQVTVLNADQYATGFRLNDGPWQAVPDGGFNPTDPPNGGYGVAFTFGPASIPGAQAGTNTLYMRIHETVGGAAGVMAHMIVAYDLSTVRSWTQMVCCDGSVWYLDDTGQPVSMLPEGSTVVPCTGGGSSAAQAVEVFERCGCDQTPGGVVRFTELWRVPVDGTAPVLIGRYRDGDFTQPYPTVVSQIDCP